MRNRLKQIACACAAWLCCTACAANESSAGESSAPQAEGITLTVAEGTDQRYGETLQRYFEAIEQKDYEAYKAVVYPPYFEAYSAYLTKNGSTPEGAFADLCTIFDEDGYESWTLTALDVSTYSINTEYQQTDGISDYFSAYAARGIFGEDFEQKCRDAAEDIRDIQFSVSALYAGDEAPVEVAHGKEIMMLIDSDGCWVFG